MSFIGSMLGIGQGGQYAPAAATNVINPVTGAQANTAYDQTQQGLAQQQAFLAALQGQNGVGNQSAVFNQLQGVANGTGPNPAQAMLANATGQNAAQQGALMASQRGAGANPALLARQAAQQGGALQQQAAGQGAALQAQQSLGALNQLGGIANQQVGNQAGALNAYNSAAQGQQGQLLGSINNQNQVNAGQQANINNNNAGLAGINSSAVGGALSGLGSALSVGAKALAAEGGEINTIGKEGYPGKSKAGMHLHGMAKGGKVPALVSPGERYLPPSEVKKVEQGKKSPMKAGEKIPGKPKYPGNDYRNDTTPKTLQEGGIVIPNEVLQSKNPEKAAHAFISAIIARHGSMKGKK